MMLERGTYLVPTLIAPPGVPAAGGDKWHSDAGRLSSGQSWLPSTGRSLVGPRRRGPDATRLSRLKRSRHRNGEVFAFDCGAWG